MSIEKIRPFVDKLDGVLEKYLGLVIEQSFPINEILYYGISGDNLHIHFEDASRFSNAKKEELMNNGLKNLAIIVASNPEIKKVTACSWMVARFPRQIKKLGFEIMGPVGKEVTQKYFKNEKRPVHWAMMSREEFLVKYLHKN